MFFDNSQSIDLLDKKALFLVNSNSPGYILPEKENWLISIYF